MEFAARTTTALIVFLLVFVVGGILLQIFLSRREAKWPGLILPVLTFLYSILMALGVVSYDGGTPWGAILAALLLGNIPTAILLAIYAACREKRKRKDGIDKMNIQDL